MTHEEWALLTEEEQRIKVAELCGWTKIRHVDGETSTGDRKRMLIALAPGDTGEARLAHCCMHNAGIPYGVGGLQRGEWELPDYLNDLNAMHEAETSTSMDAHGWLGTLYQVVLGFPPMNDTQHILVLHATAAQRAEAFVLAMTEGKAK
jgi:hypothetical protein